MLLQYLATREGQVVSRSDISKHLYGQDDEASSNVVDVYIGYLRNKIDKPYDKKLIHKALDGEANQSETKKLQQKMEADGRVRSEFEQLKQVVKDTTRIRVDVPADFTKKVLDETKRIRKPKP